MTLRKFIMGSALVSGIRGSAPTKATELFAGVEKPTITLAHMLVAEMIQNLDVAPIDESARGNNYPYSHVTRYRYEFPKFSLKLIDGNVSSCQLHADKSASFLGAEEKIILKAGWEKFNELRGKMLKNKAESARQELAVELISSFFKSEQATEG